MHTALKIAPLYPNGVVVHTSDASAVAPIALELVGSGREKARERILREQEALRLSYAEKHTPLLSLAQARAQALHTDWEKVYIPAPQRTGVFRVMLRNACPCCTPQTGDVEVSPEQILERADWSILLRVFSMQNAWNPARRAPHESASAEQKEQVLSLIDDAQNLFRVALREQRLHVRACFGIWEAQSCGDDLIVRPSGKVLHTLRVQKESSRPRLALADFVPPAPHTGYVGALQVSVSGAETWCAEFEAQNDTYSSLLGRALANTLAEAMAELVHAEADRIWRVADTASIRPACGYPTQPDHAEKQTIFDLLDAPAQTGAALTESFMITPPSSVCALLFHHPAARYFSVLPVGEDQLADYEARTGRPAAFSQ